MIYLYFNLITFSIYIQNSTTLFNNVCILFFETNMFNSKLNKTHVLKHIFI